VTKNEERKQRVRSAFHEERAKLHAMGPWAIFWYSRRWGWRTCFRWVGSAARRRLSAALEAAQNRGLYYAWIELVEGPLQDDQGRAGEKP
jgi:hypothetical protein